MKAAHPSNDVEEEVKMFEEGAWQQPDSAQKGPGRPIIADERAQESVRVSNAWTQNHSQRVSGSIEVRSSGRLQNQAVRRSQEQTQQQQKRSPDTNQIPTHAEGRAESTKDYYRIENIADYYHKQQQVLAASPR